jgi:sulfite reductase (NADPH) flavoprotein alpha-component
MLKATPFMSPSMRPRRRLREHGSDLVRSKGHAVVLSEQPWTDLPRDYDSWEATGSVVGAVACNGAAAGDRMSVRSITILFATETGASEDVANALRREAEKRGLQASIADLADTEASSLADIDVALFVASTTGDGDVPYAAEGFFKEIASDNVPRLDHLRYAVLALGDSSYQHFCAAGRRLDDRLAALGATRLLERVDCDIDYEEPATAWRADVLGLLLAKPVTVSAEVPSPDPDAARREKYHLVEAVVTDSRVLTGPGSTKATRHLALSLLDTNMTYEPGDALGVVVENEATVVAAVLAAGGLRGDANVTVKRTRLPLETALRSYCEITTVTPRFLESWVALTGSDVLASQALQRPAEARATIMHGHHIVDIMRRFPAPALEPQAFIQMLRPLQPRLYSIASSMRATPREVHLTIAPVVYTLHGEQRRGVATGQLCERTPVGARLQIYVQPNAHFRLPAPEVPIIMIGAGTGVAPYRAFLQERAKQMARGPAWLFFGERNRACDFLYEAELEGFRRSGVLTRLDTAFSRDGPEKVYVQHRLIDRAHELTRWIDEGAHVYVCGDAAHMAPDVHASLIRAIEHGLCLKPDQAEAYVTTLQREGRYQRDVY